MHETCFNSDFGGKREDLCGMLEDNVLNRALRTKGLEARDNGTLQHFFRFWKTESAFQRTVEF